MLNRLRWQVRQRLGTWSHPELPRASAAAGEHFECDAWELGHFVRRRLLPRVGTHPFPPNELMLMSGAFLWTDPDLVIEWGTNIGVSALVFFETKRYFGLRAEIHSVDLPDPSSHMEHPGSQRGMLVRGTEVHLHEGDGVGTARSLIEARGTDRPLVFIDGDHQKDSVLHEISSVLEAAPSASLLVHDTFPHAVTGYNTGPAEAVGEALIGVASHHRAVTEELGRPGMTFLYRPFD